MIKNPWPLRLIDNIGDWIGKLTSFLITVVIGIMIYSVVRRYIFNYPFNYLTIIPRYFLVFIALGAAYTFHARSFVNVDILQVRLSPRTRATVDLFTSSLFFLFILALFMTTFRVAIDGLPDKVYFSTRLLRGPTWLVDLLVSIGVLFLLLQGIAKFIRDLLTAITGKDVA